jgi:hypothetical protein
VPAADLDLTQLAAQAFVYGFPLVFNLQQVDRFTREGIGGLAPAPFNTFSHAAKLAGPKDTFVSINNDTVYSIAQLDVGGGAVRLDVPATDGRYYVLQFVDAWTNNFAYVGHRATGSGAGAYLLVPPDWDGAAGEDEAVIRLPTRVATIVGRWAIADEADLPTVAALQAGLSLTPTGEAAGLPSVDASWPEDLRFFARLRAWEHAFPPAARDREYAHRFAPLADAGPDTLRAALAAGRERMEAALRRGAGPAQNGWSLTYHVFDYNLDFFELGALDEDRWKLPDDPGRYLLRALAARGGLWGNHGYEAAYAMIYDDAGGATLDGSGRYELRFDRPPPCRAFWSVTMYDTPDFYLVDNPIGRYSIGDRTPGLHTADDGSLTIVMQQDEPAERAARANWLPTPAGDFRPILRMYEPDEAVFDGSYALPPVTRVAA